MPMRAVEIIARKRDGLELADEDIRALVDGYTTGNVPDYQMAAFAMAVLFRGMTAHETAVLLDAMEHSGVLLRWDDLPMPTADKHSTGGVGDKVSIPLAPAVAACGVAVPMISGRGLGHTGGTLDKLESIPGFDVRMPLDRFQRQIANVGVAMIGQTERLVPADRKLYALRDVTATIESIPLIVASILSKKLASGVGSLVLDVKLGRGAFMKTPETARELAQAMVDAGRAAGRNMSAFITAMDRPLGTHVGNSLEIVESLAILRGGGPDDTRALTVRMGGEMLRLAGVATTLAEGEARIEAVLNDGRAMRKFADMVEAQGGDSRIIERPELLPRAPVVVPWKSDRTGNLVRLDALEVGLAAVRLGAGRNTAEDRVDPRVGFVLHKRPGEAVVAGEVLAEVHAATESMALRAIRELDAAAVIGDEQAELLPLFVESVG